MYRSIAEANAILISKAGSHLYGLNTVYSDIDYKGVFIAPLNYYLGLDRVQHKDNGWDTEKGIYDFLDNSDCCLYELQRYLELCINSNPNVIELLWSNLDNFLVYTDSARKLVESRDLFISKKIFSSMLGYANAQIYRMEQHRRWLLDPPKRKPYVEDFNLTEDTLLSKSELNAFLEFLYMLIRDRIEYLEESEELYNLLVERIDIKGVLKQHNLPLEVLPLVQHYTRAKADFIHLLHLTQAYRTALSEWNNYQVWLTTRNPKRFEIEKKCGFDGKHASHCIRLLRMSKEFVKEGELLVDRKLAGDSEELINIKLGEYTYAHVKDICDDLFSEVRELLETTNLPENCKQRKISDLCMEILTSNVC